MWLGIEIFWLNPDFIPQMRRKVTRKDTVLAKSSLFRFDEGRDTEARLQKVLSYNYEKSEYYGQVPGMIKALPTQVWPLTQAFAVFYKFLISTNCSQGKFTTLRRYFNFSAFPSSDWLPIASGSVEKIRTIISDFAKQYVNPVFFWPNLCPLRFSWAMVRASLFCGAFRSPRFKRRRWWLDMPSNTTQQSTLRSSERQSRKRYHTRWAAISIPNQTFWICWGSNFLEVVNTKLRGFVGTIW